MPTIICAHCPHGKMWHENGTGRCTYRKRRNTGEATGRKGRCGCEKFRAGESVPTPNERMDERLRQTKRT
jgi:hypothetical protein